jgi:uncharacterized Fe-S cluster-containing radical SAM superfamily enzyme
MRKHFLITKLSGIPLIGVHVFGIIDRGNNLLQIRPISGCPLSCVFCSVDEGPSSKKLNTYEVEVRYLIEEFNKVVAYKGINNIEAHIDGVGEPLLYKDIAFLVRGLKSNPNVKVVSMQTHGTLLTESKIKELKDAGLTRINLSIDSLKPDKAIELCGTKTYDLEKIKIVAKKIVESGMNLLITPVIVPGYNDSEIEDFIVFAKEIGASLGIQKYAPEKHGRPLKVKEETWYKFYEKLKSLEKKHSIKLILSKNDFSLVNAKMLPVIFKIGEEVRGKVVLPGWLSNEVIINVKGRLVTVFHSENSIGDAVKAKIVKTKHNLYLASIIKKV